MYHPPSQRKQLLQRVAVYSLMTTAVIGLVSALVFFMLGYQFNRSDGTLEQGGLVQFNSQPTGANIVIDGNNLGTRTTSKRTMTSGQHFISMQRSGYKAWQKSIDVVPGSVLWLTYAKLVPNDLTPANIADFPVISSVSASPNNETMAIKAEPATPIINLADLTRDDARVTAITIPEASYTAPDAEQPQTFALQDWDTSNRFVMVKHTYNEASVEWLVVDTQNVAATKNVTTLLGVEATSIEFSNNDPSILYALIDNAVRKINIDAETLSGPLVSNVAEFSLFDNSTIVYVTRIDEVTKMRSVGYHSDDTTKSRTIRSYSDNGQIPLHIAIGQYFSDHYIAISYNESVEIIKGALPRSDVTNPTAFEAVSTMTIPGGAQYLSIITKGRFIVAQTAKAYVVYDLELKRTTTTELKSTSDLTRQLQWIDNYTVWNDASGVLRLYEFDGANQHDIMPVVAGFDAAYSPTGKYLYSIGQTSDTEYHLQRVRMILP